MTEWFGLLRKGDVDGVSMLLAGLDEQRRRQLGVDLVAHVRARRDSWWWNDEATALAVAAVGCLPTAAKTAELLGRRSVSLPGAAAAPVLEAARERGISWMLDLAYRLAERLPRDASTDGWRFIAELLMAEKAPPPTGDRFVEGWLMDLAWPPESLRRTPLVDRLRADPFLDTLVSRLFEVDGLGTRMTSMDFVTDQRDAFPHALVLLASEDRIDRAMLLDGCLDRLLRGDRPAALRPFVALHGLLQPSLAEVGARCGNYLRLLADAPAPVASMAQKTLRDVDTIEVEAFLDTSQAVLIRPDKALVRAQLSWLDRLARQRPERKAEIAAVIAVAVDHPAVEIRDRASALAARYGHSMTPIAVVTATGDELPPPHMSAPAPPPITDPDELAEEAATLLSTRFTALPLERVLDGVVRLASIDRPRLNQALKPVIKRHPDMGGHSWDPYDLRGILTGILHAAINPVGADTWQRRWGARLKILIGRQSTDQWSTSANVLPPHRLLRARLAEIGDHVGAPGRQGLLSAPIACNGAIDPAVLYDRIAQLGDVSPWPWDLTQALLRLPAGTNDDLATRAAALGTPAGDRLAAWLRAGGLPNPDYRPVVVSRRERRHRYDWEYDRLPERRTHVEVIAPEGYDDPVALLAISAPPIGDYYNEWSALWPAVLPGYRGLMAAYVLPQVAATADLGLRDCAEVLPLVAECTGEGSLALDLALAYGLGARHEADRIATLDALLMLAAAGNLDAVAVGSHLGALAAGGTLTLTRTVQPLRDAVAAGARLTTWRLLAAALPALLSASTPPRGTPDLLTLAAETAGVTGITIEVPGLAEVATRGGSSRLVTEAQRLAKALSR